MAYSNYPGPPEVNVTFERSSVETRSQETEFHTVFLGTGVTSRNRNIVKSNLRADTSLFPSVELTFDLAGDINTDLFSKTKFTIGQIEVTYANAAEGSPATVALNAPTDFTVSEQVTFSDTDSLASVVLNVTKAGVSAADVIYKLNITASNVDSDFDLRLVGSEDRFFSNDLFGPVVLKENGVEFFNDIMIAADIAFRMSVPRFYYLEVPRDYGETPTLADYQAAIEKIYFEGNAYRVVVLTSEVEVIQSLNQFILGVSNPVDRRETVGFVTYDTSQITSINDIAELETKVGGFSESINNKRICNVFAGESAEYRINNQVYVLPEYFFAVAVASLDAVVGKVDPLSTREITVFERINGPRFRPRDWNKLAKKGVFIIKKDNDTSPAEIRHQLTTAQSDLASDQEYSVIKNWDVVTKKIRDRLKPYAGRNNIDAGYTERLEGTLTTVREEILEEKLAKSLTVITPWALKEDNDNRNLATRLRMDPVYPANELDVFIIV
jgi:hypothetical protein